MESLKTEKAFRLQTSVQMESEGGSLVLRHQVAKLEYTDENNLLEALSSSKNFES